ncbi:winged helix-turn-helix transcriptional regulator [Pseudovibrio ascidiaceicola]|uniref:winged helix-turn-helix transcriptional regulator n=1 Tax=Pseudovibrio ascidiaceicola TaxID=285279 RepID=UPI003D36A207
MAKLSDKTEHQFRSGCSISRTLEIVGDKWTLLIIRDLMWHDKHTFKDLQDSAEHMPANILTTRLNRLMEWGLIYRTPYQDKPVRYTYHLTEAGLKTETVLLQIMQWGHENLGGGKYNPETRQSLSAN